MSLARVRPRPPVRIFNAAAIAFGEVSSAGVTATGLRGRRRRAQAFGELARPSCRDDVSLAFEEPGGSFADGGGLGGGSGQLPDFGGVQQPVALPVKPVRGLDERRRRREQRLGFVDGPLPGAELALYAAPEELGRD